MPEQTIQTHALSNGLSVIVEPMRDVQSAAMTLLVPSGSIYDPPGQNGSAAVLCELIVRGAGDRDSQELSAALDIGVIQTGTASRAADISCRACLRSSGTRLPVPFPILRIVWTQPTSACFSAGPVRRN